MSSRAVGWVRAGVIALVLAAAIWAANTYVAHHEGGIFQTLFLHLMPQRLVEGGGHGGGHPLLAIALPSSLGFFDMAHELPGVQLVATNLQIFQVAAVLMMLACFVGVPYHLRTGRGDVLGRMFAGFASWIRDEMVVPVMGKDLGNKLLPLFLSLFFFILFMNLMGLVPGASTATASIFVTAGLAVITFVTMLVGGMIAQGPIAFWKNLVPHVPAILWPLMFVVELLGLIVKPLALTIRLFANMTGGHLAVLCLMGLILFFGTLSPLVGYLSSPVAVGLAVFIMIIESFVALLQAYIFTTLSIIFIQACVHPEH